jgi:hypothetical protein
MVSFPLKQTVTIHLPKIKPLFQGARSYLQLPATLLSCDAQEAAVERQKHWLEKLAAHADDQKE